MKKSQELYKIACEHIPGGVNSPVRAFKGVGGSPIFFKEGKGPYLTDEDNYRYIDYVGSWGTAIVGHAHTAIIEKVSQALNNGLSFGAPTAIEHQLAQLIKSLMPHIEQVRMVNSGTEATMSAIRLARGFTGKNKIIKFDGCYHGHYDGLLVKSGSGGLTYGIPDSAGVPKSIAEHTLTATYNNIETVETLFRRFKSEIAAVIVEPIAANMNCILPKDNFLKELQALCTSNQTLLIFDEVITGFRVHPGGAAALFDIEPDLVTLGKIIGGGLPVGAFGGKKEIMQQLAPLGPVYQAGTLSGNPIAMCAGFWTLKQLQSTCDYSFLNSYTRQLVEGICERAIARKIPLKSNYSTGLFGLFFTEEQQISCLDDVKKCHLEHYKKFFHKMCQHGVYFAPSMYEAGFISFAHSKIELEETLRIAEEVFDHWDK